MRDARNALRDLVPLDAFAVAGQAGFSDLLDEVTNSVAGAMGPANEFWGLGRKVVNIYLRGVLYNHYLRRAYSFEGVEPVLELPLDTLTASGLIFEARNHGLSLPTWPRIKRLTPAISGEYQHFALRLAADEGIARVHLDAYFWTSESGDRN